MGLGYFPNKAIGLTALSLLIYPESQHTLKALRGTQTCVRKCHTKFSSVPEEHIFKGKMREAEELKLLRPPSSKDSCTLPSFSEWPLPPGNILPSLRGERKNNEFVAAVPGPLCPQRAAIACRGCHCPPRIPKWFLALEGGQSESCPSATNQHDQCHVESPEHQPLLPRTQPQGDLWVFHTTMKETSEQMTWKDAGTDLTLESGMD